MDVVILVSIRGRAWVAAMMGRFVDPNGVSPARLTRCLTR
jgi:hypothetical protein